MLPDTPKRLTLKAITLNESSDPLQEALSRIEEVERTGGPELDLAN